MSSVQNLRALINERLTAAAEEIFTEFEKTIVQYEEEIDRQRRLLDITWKPQMTLQTTELPQQHVYEDNVLCEQNLCDQGRNSSLDQQNPEPPQIKEEQVELTSLKGEQIVLMQEVDMLVQCESKCDQVSGEIFKSNEEIDRQRRLLDIIWKPQVTLHRIDFPQQHVCIEEKGLNDQKLCNQKRNFTLDQEDPEPSQIKEEQEKLCTSQERKDQEPPQIKTEQEELCTSLFQKDPEPPQVKEEQQELCISQKGEQIILKQATDTFLLTSTNEDSDHTELEPNSDQLLSYNFSVAESPHQEGSKHVDSGSSTNEELKPKKSHNRNSSHSTNVDKSSLSESHCVIDTDIKSVKCDVCGKTFKTKNQMKKHRLIHDDVKPHACNACGKSFSFNSQLKAHMIIHKGEKGFCCKTCGKHFSHSGSLTVHMRTHTGNKPYFCETCGKRFHQSYNLTIHMRTHTSEKPYFCETCGKRFSRSDNLAVHMRTHTSEKPYFCETCGKSFSQSYNLTVHMRTHTSEKPYYCEICGKGFNQRNNLNIHMRTHRSEKPYSCRKAVSCKTCGKSFTRGSTLTVHMRTHTGEKPFFCETCGKSFIQRSHLTIHMRTHTGEKLLIQ